MADKFCEDHKYACKEIHDAVEDVKVIQEELPKKASYKTLSIFLTVLIGVISYFAYSTLEHRGQIAATAATVKALCENTEKIQTNQEFIMKKMDTFNTRQLRVMQKLDLDPKWGE